MLVAYLRGLLKPNYPNGTRSIIRENTVLQALSRELDSQEVLARIANESSYAALMAPAQANKLLKHHDKMLSLAFEGYRHKINKNVNKHNVDINSIDKFINAYNKLKAQGLVGVIPEKEQHNG